MNDQQLRRIYNGFEIKDMSFEAFAKEINGLSDPVQMQNDLANIQVLKQRAKTTKQNIDRARR